MLRNRLALEDVRRSSRGGTLVELLITLSVIAVLIAVILPAIQFAREAARNSTCKSHLRQVAVAICSHDIAQSRLPTGGWGFQWVGDPDNPASRDQPGGWIFSMLPYIEANNVHGIGSGGAGPSKFAALGKMLQTPVPVLVCPCRRGVELKPFLGQYPLHNAEKPAMAFKSDYAGCGGDERLRNGEGPAGDSPEALRTYQWPHTKATGVFFAGSRVRAAEITDGLSNTYLVGEKYVRMRPATGPEDRDFGDDQAAYIGDDRDIRRWTAEPPLRDQRDLDAPDVFGSRHPASWNMLFADGSVRSLSYTIDAEIHRTQGNRHDGLPGAAP